MNVWGHHFENSGVGHYRMWQPFDALNRLGLCECKRPPDDVGKTPLAISHDEPDYDSTRGSVQEFVTWADLVVYQRMNTMPELMTMMATMDWGRPVIAECDDNLFEVPVSNNAYRHYRPSDQRDNVLLKLIKAEEAKDYKDRTDGLVVEKDGQTYFATQRRWDAHGRQTGEQFLRIADAVTTTTETLAQVFSKFNPYVYVLPNCVDVARWTKARERRQEHEEIRLGWFGGMQHYDDLLLIKDVVPAILEKYPNVHFHTTSVIPDFWEQFAADNADRFHTHYFTPVQQWPEILANYSLDIALAPLVPNRFNVCKSNLKLLEFGALGVPCIYSPVGPYLEVKNATFLNIGLTAEGRDDWIGQIGKLIENRDLREQIALNSCAYVKMNYDQNVLAHQWAHVYEEVYDRTHKMRKKHAERVMRKWKKRPGVVTAAT